MSDLIRKICTTTVLGLALASLLGGCANGSKKSYCDFVVENDRPIDDVPAKSGVEDVKESTKPKKKLRN